PGALGGGRPRAGFGRHRSLGGVPGVSGEHRHDHDHAGGHGELEEIEARVLAIESLLVEKGLIHSEAVDRVVYRFEHDIGPMLGAKVVAKAWTDPEFKSRLLADGTAAIEELGIDTSDLHLEVVENRPGVHNLVV